MLNIVKSKPALSDAEDIWVYTYENWGETQANRYLNDLQQTIIKLAQNPEQGRLLPVLQGQHYRYFFQSHMIIYRFNTKELQIVRILHKRMDIARHKLQ